MRINRPRSFNGGNSTDSGYNLTTVNELNTTKQVLSDEITTTYNTVTKNYNELVRGVDVLANGETQYRHSAGAYGYAWLTADGVIDPKLMPKIALNETHVITEKDLFPEGTISADFLTGQQQIDPEKGELIEDVLVQFIERKAAAFADPENPNHASGYETQIGDIFVVIPSVTVEGNTRVRAESNPNIHGTFIVTKDPTHNSDPIEYPVDSDYDVKRLSYDSGKAISINGKSAGEGNKPGEITLYLHDILQLQEVGSITSEAASDLEDTVYRLNTYTDTAEDPKEGYYRFAFTDKNGDIVPYAKLQELKDTNETLTTEVTRIDTAISELTQTVQAQDRFLSGQISGLQKWVGTEEEAASTPTFGTDWATSGTIAQRTAQLRYELEARTDALSGVYINVEDLAAQFRELADNAVLLKYETITWADGDADDTINQGYLTWTKTYEPNYNGDSDIAANMPERIVAVYDDENNLVFPDIKINKITGQTTITIWQDLASAAINSNKLTGKTWTLLIAENYKKVNPAAGWVERLTHNTVSESDSILRQIQKKTEDRA